MVWNWKRPAWAAPGLLLLLLSLACYPPSQWGPDGLLPTFTPRPAAAELPSSLTGVYSSRGDSAGFTFRLAGQQTYRFETLRPTRASLSGRLAVGLYDLREGMHYPLAEYGDGDWGGNALFRAEQTGRYVLMVDTSRDVSWEVRVEELEQSP